MLLWPSSNLIRALPDECGAKLLLQSHVDGITAVPFPDGALDIDTPADLRHLHSETTETLR